MLESKPKLVKYIPSIEGTPVTAGSMTMFPSTKVPKKPCPSVKLILPFIPSPPFSTNKITFLVPKLISLSIVKLPSIRYHS